MKIGGPFQPGANFEHLLKGLTRQTQAGPVPIFEGLVDAEIACEILDFDFPADRVSEIVNVGLNPTLAQWQLGCKLMERVIAFSIPMGYDGVSMAPRVPIPRTPPQLRGNPRQQGLILAGQEEGKGIVSTREDFEAPGGGFVNGLGQLGYELLQD